MAECNLVLIGFNRVQSQWFLQWLGGRDTVEDPEVSSDPKRGLMSKANGCTGCI